MTRIDLNAKRAARAATRGEGLVVVLGEESFTLAPELPVAVMELVEINEFAAAIKLIVGEADWTRFLAQSPTMHDVMDIVEAYGVELGESSASAGSSTSTGAPSRPTSRAAIDEILPIRVGDQAR